MENFKNLLVRNHWTNFNIILQKCSFGDPLPRLFKPFPNQNASLLRACCKHATCLRMLINTVWACSQQTASLRKHASIKVQNFQINASLCKHALAQAYYFNFFSKSLDLVYFFKSLDLENFWRLLTSTISATIGFQMFFNISTLFHCFDNHNVYTNFFGGLLIFYMSTNSISCFFLCHYVTKFIKQHFSFYLRILWLSLYKPIFFGILQTMKLKTIKKIMFMF